MLKHALSLGLVAALLAFASGCGVFRAVVCEPFGPGFGPDIAHCPRASAGCDAPCAPAPSCEPRLARAYAPCGDCGAAGDDLGCGPYSDGHCGPLTWVFSLLCRETFCGSGCGPKYYGEWYSDPPDCCDPCEFCGGGQPGCSACGRAAEPAGCQECGGEYSSAPRRATLLDARAPSRPASAYAPRIVSQSERVVAPAGRVASPTARSTASQAARPSSRPAY